GSKSRQAVKPTAEVTPCRPMRSTSDTKSSAVPVGLRKVNRVAGEYENSFQGTTRTSPSSSPSGNGALTLKPMPISSNAKTASGQVPRNISSAGAGSND